MARRVFEIAKELGVPSKRIVEKCHAEGIPKDLIKNHMSSVSVGVEATILDWFGSEASESSVVETASRVDLGRAKARPKPPKKVAAASSEHAPSASLTGEPPNSAPDRFESPRYRRRWRLPSRLPALRDVLPPEYYPTDEIDSLTDWDRHPRSPMANVRLKDLPSPRPARMVPARPADLPVDWRPFSPEMLKRSHLEGAGIFLSEQTLDDIVTSLLQGRHLLFTGPPGCGKTEVAKLLPALLFGKEPLPYQLATANASWSVYDIIGGPQLTSSGTRFVPGVFTQAVSRSVECNGAYWLILDEINRADIDKALGPVFTTLADGILRIEHDLDHEDDVKPEYSLPDRFRVVATMNSIDKNSLFAMSAALQRRFAVIDFLPPPLEHEKLRMITEVRHILKERAGVQPTDLDRYIDSLKLELLVDDCLSIVEALRKASVASDGTSIPELRIGTAIVLDIVRFASLRQLISDRESAVGALLDSAFRTQLMPQLTTLQIDDLETVATIFDGKPHTLPQCRDLLRSLAAGSGFVTP